MIPSASLGRVTCTQPSPVHGAWLSDPRSTLALPCKNSAQGCSQLCPGKRTQGAHTRGNPEGVPKIAAAGRVAPKRCLSLGYKQQVDGKMTLNGMACVPSVLATTGARHMGSDSCLYSIPGGSFSFLYLLMFSLFPLTSFPPAFRKQPCNYRSLWVDPWLPRPLLLLLQEVFLKSQVQNTHLQLKLLSLMWSRSCVFSTVLYVRICPVSLLGRENVEFKFCHSWALISAGRYCSG